VAAIFGKAGLIAVAGMALIITAVLTLRERSIRGIWEITTNPEYAQD